MIETIRVALGPRSYDVAVGAGLIGRAGRRVAEIAAGAPVFVVTDETVARLYLPELEASLAEAGLTHAAEVLPAGEATKDFAHLERLVGAILDRRPERGSAVVALGGGVVGDIAGVAASLVLRGIALIQIPTTLLAQVDSAVGGKTAINTAHGKNLVGAFHQPRLVLADTAALDTLDRRELAAGYAEIVKYGVIGDRGFFDWLERNGAGVIDGDRDARRRAVLRSCEAKAAIVAEDERERGRRALLNLGHTFGHALEAAAGYGARLLHGEAVAIGMTMALDLSAALGLCPAEDARRVRRHLEAVGLPTAPAEAGLGECRPGDLLGFMHRDKKTRGGRMALVLARGIGAAFVSADVAPEAVEEALRGALAA